MKEKAIRVWLLLNNKEQEQFEKWLRFRFSESKSQFLIEVLKQLRLMVVTYSKIKMEQVISNIKIPIELKNKPIAKIAKDTSYDLKKELLNFLSWQEFSKDEIQVARHAQDALLSKKAYQILKSENQQMIRKIEKKNLHNTSVYKNKSDIYEMAFYLKILTDNRNVDDNLMELMGNIEQYTFSKILMYYNAALNRSKILKINYNFPFKETLIPYLEKNKNSTPFIDVHLFIFKLLNESEKSEKEFGKAKKIILEKGDCFSVVDKRHVVNLLLNYADFRIVRGEEYYLKEYFALMQYGLKEKIWLEGTYFSSNYFVKFVKVSLKLKEIEWCEIFINKYKHFLNPSVAQDRTHLAFSLFYFEKNNYESANEYRLKLIKDDDFSYFLDFRILHLKILYETFNDESKYENYGLSNYIFEALRQYLSSQRNRDMSEEGIISFRNLLVVFKKLWTIKMNVSLKNESIGNKLDSLEKEIKSMDFLQERIWLKEKINGF